jgi:hypothetical protein
VTAGRLYQDVTPDEIAVLDRFEGRLYRRRPQVVLLDNGRRTRAWVYMVAAGQRNRVSPTPWRLDRFLRTEYHRFMQRFVEDRRHQYDLKPS